MKKVLVLVFVCTTVLLFIYASAEAPLEPVTTITTLKQPVQATQPVVKVDADLGKRPLYFVRNNGQGNPQAVFQARTSRYTLWLTQRGLVFDSCRSADEVAVDKRNPKGNAGSQWDASRMFFIGASVNPQMTAIESSQLKVNYFKGDNPSQWKSAGTSRAVMYKGLYNQIDLKVYGVEREIEYDWLVHPGGDPSFIQVEYRDVINTRIDAEGNLLVETRFGQLMHKKPLAYQEYEENGKTKRTYIDVTFRKTAASRYGFNVGSYDRSRSLVIDPVILSHSTYLGGWGSDTGNAITVDAEGCIYITGKTFSGDFPTMNPYQAKHRGVHDVFVTKWSPPDSDGESRLLYSTFICGSGQDTGIGIAVDADGCIYVAGNTKSTDFPTRNSYQSHQSNTGDHSSKEKMFVVKLDPNLTGESSLRYATYLGGSGKDICNSLAIDKSGRIYIAGNTSSTDFPVRNGFQPPQGLSDGFVSILDPALSGDASLIYSTCIGGSENDSIHGIAVDDAGRVYLAGETFSPGFPTMNPYQAVINGNVDAFISILDPTGNSDPQLLYSTYLGGRSNDYGRAVSIDAAGCIYILGDTDSTDFPVSNAFQALRGGDGQDCFVAKLDPDQDGRSQLRYSSYLGGSGDDYGTGIAVGKNGYAYVTGKTDSDDFPTLNPYMIDPGDEGEDAFMVKLDPSQIGDSSLLYSTYLGGSRSDSGMGITVAPSGKVYVTGYTSSPDYPLQNPVRSQPADGEAFIAEFASVPTVRTITVTAIGTDSARGGGRIPDNGGDTVTACGLCWSANPNPTIGSYRTILPGDRYYFTCSLKNGLKPYTLYYVRAYAENAQGVGYGNEVSFITKPEDNAIPMVSTLSIDLVTANSAYGHGRVISAGSSVILAQGLCWSTSPNPTRNNHSLQNPTTSSYIYGTLTPLQPSTLYYVRAYATNAVGTAYGNQLTFSTTSASIMLPVVTTNPTIINITAESARGGGNVLNNGGGTVTARGLCWSHNPNPTIGNYRTILGGDVGPFACNLRRGLKPNTKYYVRAYAENAYGIGYGVNVTFTTKSQ